jgi:tetratricopeptide (TPR) repeat protein
MGALGHGKAAAAVEQWSRRQQEDLSDRRKRELNQLLDRFDKDTLDALRHAIPLTGSEARRGNAATPGWKLGARNPDLDPFSKGSGAVDVWSINAETRLKLEKKYRDAAAREAAAGQWGRAAYIHGELLGDWARAAEMLEKGGRPREAARIYMERLRSGLRAAQCMEKAGLLAEAAGLFREAGQIEKAGDLMAALGQPEEARALWEKALAALTNPLEQARLMEEKL